MKIPLSICRKALKATTETVKPAKKSDKPCRKYEQGDYCESGFDHCFNCGRHLKFDGHCSRNCGEGNDTNDDDANNDD